MTKLRGLNYWRKLIAIWSIAVVGSFVLIGAISAKARAAGSVDSFTIKLGLKDVWPPAPVADLDAVHGDEGKALLIWTAPDENNDMFAEKSAVSEYMIKIATFSIDNLAADTTAWWNLASDIAGAPAPLPPGSTQTMLLDSLTPGGTYFFAIRSLDNAALLSPIDAKASASGRQASVVIFDAAPPAPANLTAVPGNGRVTLVWNAVSVPDLWFYRIHVDSTPPYDFGDQFLISVASTATSFVHTGLTPGTTYSYFVTAVDKGAPDYAGYALESAGSNTVSTMTLQVPPAPAGLTPYGVFASSLAVSWNAAAGAASYTLVASTSSDFTGAISVPTANTFSVLTNLSADTTYFLRVNASNVEGPGVFSNPVSTPTLANAPLPKAFDNVTVSAFRANWLPNGNPAATGYRIEISTAMNFSAITLAAGVNGSSAAFISLATDTTYYARARAVNAAKIPTLWVDLGGVVTAYGVLAVSADKLTNVWYAVPPTSFNAQGADHYHYKIASSSSDLPSSADPSFYGAPLTLDLSDGIWYFNVRGEGPAHNPVGYASYGPLEIDSLPPVMTAIRAQSSATDLTPALSDVPSDAPNPRFSWDVPVSRSPILGYSYAVFIDSASEPGDTVNTALNFLDYAVPSVGIYYLKVKALGGSGNWSPWASFTYIFLDLPSQTSVTPENNYFNPRSARQMLLHCDIHRPGRVRIRIFNLRGELIKTLEDAQKPSGRYTITWDGLNNSGETVATGVYLVYAEAPGYKRTFKCIVAR